MVSFLLADDFQFTVKKHLCVVSIKIYMLVFNNFTYYFKYLVFGAIKKKLKMTSLSEMQIEVAF